MRNYILFLLLMLCASAFPNGINVGKEVLGIDKIAEDVRTGKIEKINIKRNRNGKLSVEIVYRENSCSFLIEKNDGESFVLNSLRQLKPGTGNGNRELLKYRFNSGEQFRDRKEAFLKAESASEEVLEDRFTTIMSVYDFISRRKKSC